MTKEVHLYASQRVSRRAKDGKDGTSVTIISKSVTYQISASGTEIPTGNWSDKVVATTDIKPYLWTRTIVVYSDTNSTTSYSVSYKGKDGAPGKDAYRVEASPSTLVFDTNENGVVDGTALSGKYATVTVYKGNQKISVDNLSLPSNYATKKYTNVNGSISNSNGEARITIDSIEQETISGDVTVSKSSGQISFPIDVFGERSTLMWVTVNVQVNVSKFTGSVAFDNKGYKAQFDELSKGGGAATKNELTQATSTFEQTAREISLSVSEKSVGRRNMLVGSACRKYGDGFVYMSGAESQYYDGYPIEQIEKNSGIDGVNCIHCRTKQTGTDRYYLSGFSWRGTSPQGNIKLEKGKNYVLSFYAKTHTPNDIYFTAEVLYQGSKIDTSRPAGYAGPTGYSTAFAASEADKWELFTVKVSVPSNAKYEYVEINIFARARNYSFISGYICKPMLEEGENYNGWTLSEQDYDYVGGNLLDNARTLDKSGTLVTINDTVIQNGYGTDSACIKNLIKTNATLSDYKEVLRWVFGSTYLVNGNDYIFSFVAKADVDDARVVCYMWSGDIENSCDIFTEGNGGTWDSRSDGNVVFILSRQWTRYWVHWRPKNGYATPKDVIIRHTGNNSTSASTVYVTQPKLEIGATMTEWTERKSDLVDKASLKKAGIEITSEQVTLYGNKVQVKTPKENPSEGYDEAAMFQNGKLNANLIDAKNIVTRGLRAGDIDAERATIKNLSIIGSSRNPFTRMSEGTNVDYSNNVSVITNINYEFVTSNYELKWDNSQNGRRITLLNYRWHNELADGGATIKAPGGKYFFEDGLKKSALKFSRQYVELLGIGDDTDFYGWVVVNKVDVSTVSGYGHVAKVLAYGSLVATIENNKLKLTLSQKTFDGKKITVEQDAIGYKLRFPSSWGNARNFVPNITPYKFIGNIYIYERGYDYIIIRYSGKSSENRNWEDASFLFSIQTAADFNWLNEEA